MAEGTLRYDSAPARRSWIVSALRSTGFLSVSNLSRDLGVSDMTVRRDLRKLEDGGQVRVVHGGVSLPDAIVAAPQFTSRSALHADAKRRIGAAAARLVRRRDPVAVDAGTTAYELAAALPADYAGSVVTHSVPVMTLLLDRPAVRVVGLGGELAPSSRAFVGPVTVAAAGAVRTRLCFLGAAAVAPDGVFISADLERSTKLALMAGTRQVVLLADEAKFSAAARAAAPVRLCPLRRLAGLVTDAAPPGDVAMALATAGVDVRLAEADR